MQQSGPWPKLRLACYPIQLLCCATTEMQPILCCSSGESSNYSQGLRACRAGRCAAGVRGAGGLAGMLLASSIPEAHPRPPIGCPGAHPLINLCCSAGTRWDGLAWFSPTFCAPLPPCRAMILAVTSALTSFRRHAPSQGFFWNLHL